MQRGLQTREAELDLGRMVEALSDVPPMSRKATSSTAG